MCIPKRIESRDSDDCIPVFIEVLFIVAKQNVVYISNGIIFSHKRERDSDTFYNVDEP